MSFKSDAESETLKNVETRKLLVVKMENASSVKLVKK